MKGLFFLLIAAAFFVSCTKDPVSNTPNKQVTVQFTSDTISTYYFRTGVDSLIADDSVTAMNFQKDYLITNVNNLVGDTLKFTVFPPNDWVGTDRKAHISMNLLVDGVLKAATVDSLFGVDRPTGVTIYTIF